MNEDPFNDAKKYDLVSNNHHFLKLMVFFS